jgi:hypothetical protein
MPSDPANSRPAKGTGKGAGNGSPSAPPFEKGNRAAVKHGAKGRLDPKKLEVKTQAIVDALSAAAPVRDRDGRLPAADVVTVKLLADALVRLDLLGEWLGQEGLFTEDGDVRPALDLERRLRSQALEVAAELGMTPRSRAALGLDLVRGMSAAEQLSDHISRTYDVDSITTP